MYENDRQLTELPIAREIGTQLHAAFTEAQLQGSPARRRPRMRRRAMLALAAVALMALALPAYVFQFHGRSVEIGSVSTAEAIDRLARAAAARPLPFADPRQYVYTSARTRQTMRYDVSYRGDPAKNGAFTVVETASRKMWMSNGRGGLWYVRPPRREYATDADRAAGAAFFGNHAVPLPMQGYSVIGGSSAAYLAGERLNRKELLAYPTDPAGVYRRMSAGVKRSIKQQRALTKIPFTPQLVLEMTTVFSGNTSVPPKLREGMLQALALVPGVKSVGAATDSTGRTGVAFEYQGFGGPERLVFDPANAMLLEWTTKSPILADPFEGAVNAPGDKTGVEWKTANVETVTTYLDQQVVDRVPQPHARHLPPSRANGR